MFHVEHCGMEEKMAEPTATSTIAVTGADVWMTAREAAEYMRTTPGTLSTLRSDHKGPKYYKPSKRRVLYRKSDIDAWLEGGAQ